MSPTSVVPHLRTSAIAAAIVPSVSWNGGRGREIRSDAHLGIDAAGDTCPLAHESSRCVWAFTTAGRMADVATVTSIALDGGAISGPPTAAKIGRAHV